MRRETQPGEDMSLNGRRAQIFFWIVVGCMLLLPPTLGWGQSPPPESEEATARAEAAGAPAGEISEGSVGGVAAQWP